MFTGLWARGGEWWQAGYAAVWVAGVGDRVIPVDSRQDRTAREYVVVEKCLSDVTVASPGKIAPVIDLILKSHERASSQVIGQRVG